MRSAVALAIAAVAAMLLQTTVLSWLRWLPVVPDLMLVLTVYVGIRHPSAAGAVGAFVLGYFLDTFSGTLLGTHAFALTAVFAAVYLIGRHFWMESGVPVMLLVFFGGCVRALAGAAVEALAAGPAAVWQHALRYGFLEAGIAALVAPAVFACVSWEKRLLSLS
jgi:rod shape-determining protein MreD